MSQTLDVLLPFHKVDTYFIAAVNSVLASSEIKLNLLLIDDRENSSLALPTFVSSSHQIQYVRTQGGVGYGAALRQGSKLAQSDYIALMNSDDLVTRDRFSSQLRALQAADVSITGISRIKENNSGSTSLTGSISTTYYHPFYLLFGAYGANATWAMSHKWWQTKFFYDSEPALDWRIALDSFHKSEIHYSAEVKYFYRRHPNQHTAVKTTTEDFTALYSKWNQLADYYGLTQLNYSSFQFLALPWQRVQAHGFSELHTFISQILQFAEELPSAGYKQVQSLIYRRLLLSALLGQNDFGTRFKLISNSYPGVPSLIKDLIKY
jgi:glycosyltransferase involved in cell wall biosynthesis